MSKRYPGDIGEGINLLPRSRRPFRRNNEQSGVGVGGGVLDG